ncbi:MAG: hypothetical protein ACLUI3_09085 [Christensenellales bacterium]
MVGNQLNLALPVELGDVVKSLSDEKLKEVDAVVSLLEATELHMSFTMISARRASTRRSKPTA